MTKNDILVLVTVINILFMQYSVIPINVLILNAQLHLCIYYSLNVERRVSVNCLDFEHDVNPCKETSFQ